MTKTNIPDDDVKLFDTVQHYINAAREQAVNKLFPTQPERYKNEHMSRTAYAFWNHLDEHQRRRLIKFATQHYEGAH